jgi:hypothetical protein
MITVSWSLISVSRAAVGKLIIITHHHQEPLPSFQLPVVREPTVRLQSVRQLSGGLNATPRIMMHWTAIPSTDAVVFYATHSSA